jgi:predicted restriction endonuclease
LYEQFKRCPFTKIDDTRLLIASHIKPWAICNNNEKTDVSNGLLLSPLFDKLFDRGFISFKDDGELIISDWLSEENKNRIDFKYDIEDLNLTSERKSYLEYHRSYVLK